MAPTRSTQVRVHPDARVRYPAKREGGRQRVASYVCAVAFRHGMKPATLHKLLHNGERGAAQLLAEVIRESRREGKASAVQHYSDTIEAAMALPLDTRISEDLLFIQKIVADLDEDGVRQSFLLNRACGVLRGQWKRHIEVERSIGLEVWDAL